MVSQEEYEQEEMRKRMQNQPQPITDVEAPLFQKLDKIIEVMQDQKEATIALLTTLVGEAKDKPCKKHEKKWEKPEITKPLPETTQEPQPQQEQPIGDVELVKGSLPKDLQEFLEITDVGTEIKVAPRQFLGQENFNRVRTVAVNELGGKYISAGKNSHFIIPKKQPKKPEKLEKPLLEKPLPEAANRLSEIKMLFPEDLENMLTFEDKGDHIRVAPKQFLGSENFLKIASIIREANGSYVSAGKDSHFRIVK